MKMVMVSGILFLVFAALLTPAEAATLCSYNGPDLSEDMMQLTNFTVTGPASPGEGDELTIKFDITNFGQNSINLTDNGVYAAVRDKDNNNNDFGFTDKNRTLEPLDYVHFEDSLEISEKGLLDIWPSYEFWKSAYSPVLKTYVTLRTDGPDFWQGCELEICPEYCEDDVRYYDPYVGQDNNCVYNEEKCSEGCNGTECTEITADTTAPYVNVSYSPLNANITSNITFMATARDLSNITRIIIYVNGTNVKECSETSGLSVKKDSYGYIWTCNYVGGNYSAGSITYKAEAFDSFENKGSSGTKTLSVANITFSMLPQNVTARAKSLYTIAGKLYGFPDSFNKNFVKVGICPAEKQCRVDVMGRNKCEYECNAGMEYLNVTKPWTMTNLEYNTTLPEGIYIVKPVYQPVGNCGITVWEPEEQFVDLTNNSSTNVSFNYVRVGAQEPKVDVLIVAARVLGHSALTEAYSEDEIKRLETKIAEYQNVLAEEGLCSIFVYVDSTEARALTGSTINYGNEWEIRGMVQQLGQRLDSSYLLIIGGDNRQGIVPEDINDNLYGDINGDQIMDMAVGRIPDPVNGDINLLLNYFDTTIGLHRSGGLDLSSYQTITMSPPWNMGSCFHKAVYNKTCNLDPRHCKMDNDCSFVEANGKGFFTLLLHGDRETTQKFSCNRQCECSTRVPCAVTKCVGWSEGKGFIALEMPRLNVTDSVWLTATCSGSFIYNKESTEQSIPMTFLKQGGAIYIGAIDLMYGGFGCPLESGNCKTCTDASCTQCTEEISGGDACSSSMYSEIAKRFASEERIGDAFKEGMNYYLGNYDCKYGTRYHYDITRLYGDPTLKIKDAW